MSVHQSRRATRTSLALLAVGGLLTGGIASAVPATATGRGNTPSDHRKVQQVKPLKPIKAAAGKGDKLGSHDRELLTEARRHDEPTVTIMVSTKRGEAANVARSIRANGGYVRYVAGKLNYLSAVVRTAQVTKTSSLTAVRAVDLDETVRMPDQPSRASSGTDYSGPDASTPNDNPYMPTRDTGSIAFKKAHRTWDGRGITVGVLDSGVDLDSPALATTSQGQRKISDWFTATDPVTEGSVVAGGDATWLPMLQDATGPVFPATGTYRGSSWTLPATGTYKIRTLDEALTDLSGCELCGDVNRDGDTTDRIGVLYEPATHKVWVDTDDDKSFTDETAMGRYRDTHQFGHIGNDNPATDVQESVPYTVDYREHQDYTILGLPDDPWKDVTAVDIGLASGEHGSHVAGIVAANDMFGGEMDGQAPGAKLVSARACSFGAGCTAAALTDGMAELALNRGVNIINMSIGGLPALNDGANARADLYNAIINQLGVQIVISAGNSSAALNTIGDPAVATDVVAVGADITKATWQANYGSTVAFSKNIMPFSSGGPREDGGFKPNITAPGAAISTTPLWLPGSPVAEAGYDLPAGYSMLQGTSMASPQAAGAMTLLLSAAKASKVTAVSPGSLRRAVYSSAKYNSVIPAFLQGNGQINVPAAWEFFKKNIAPSTITTKAPVCTEVWRVLGQDQGTGLYNRCAVGAGGLAAGQSKTYNVTLTRTTGRARAATFNLALRGNDGTFSLPRKTVVLKKGVATVIKLTAKPSTGAHSAVLRIDNPKTLGLDGEMMAVVAVGQQFPANDTITRSGVAKRNEAQRYYVTVPEGVKALEVSMSGLSAGSQTRFLAFHPYGVPLDSTSTPNCYPHYGDPEGNGCNPSARAYSDPTPGVWEILVESRRTSPLLNNPFTLTAKLLGATVTPATVTIPTIVKDTPTPVSWTATNDHASTTAKAVGGPLGSARSERPTITATGADQTYTVDVPAGASRFDVSIGNASDPSADLDLFVTGPSGAKQSADGDSEEAVSYTDPEPGTYTVRIDNYSVPSGSTEYDYRDVFFSSALGEISVDSTPFQFDHGASKTIDGTVTAHQAVADGRSLFGSMSVVSDSGAVLGRSDVLIQEVTG